MCVLDVAAFRVFFVPFPLYLCMDYRVRRTFFPSEWCFSYLVITGWIFDISLLCENSIQFKSLAYGKHPARGHKVEKHHPEGGKVGRFLHTKRKRKWYKKYSEKATSPKKKKKEETTKKRRRQLLVPTLLEQHEMARKKKSTIFDRRGGEC